MIKKQVTGAGSETSICFPTPVKIIYHYLVWSLACTLAEPMIQGISICLWELYTLHRYLSCACVSSPTYVAISTYAAKSSKQQSKSGGWKIMKFKGWGKKLEKIITHQVVLEEILAFLLCFLARLVPKSSIPTSPVPASCLWALSPPGLVEWWEVTGISRHPNLLQVLSCCCKTSPYTSGACLPCREVRITICSCQGQGCQAKRCASAEPLALKSNLWFCHALFVAWIHEDCFFSLHN